MKTTLIFLAAALLVTGCSKMSKENYDKIKTGMSYEEVVSLIGKPEGCSEALGLSSCEWKSGKSEISVSFIGGKVSLRSSSGLK